MSHWAQAGLVCVVTLWIVSVRNPAGHTQTVALGMERLLLFLWLCYVMQTLKERYTHWR